MVYVVICILVGIAPAQLLRLGQQGRHSPSALAMLAYSFGALYTLAGLVSGQMSSPILMV